VDSNLRNRQDGSKGVHRHEHDFLRRASYQSPKNLQKKSCLWPHPEELSLDLNAEFHIRADQMSTAYRKALVK
jgi:hypothetical protein